MNFKNVSRRDWLLSNSAGAALCFCEGLHCLASAPPKIRRVLYNFDGDSCLSTKANGKGPVAITVEDVKQLIREITYEGSRVDTILVCLNAQVMYYPTRVGTQRGAFSTPAEQAAWSPHERQRLARSLAAAGLGDGKPVTVPLPLVFTEPVVLKAWT